MRKLVWTLFSILVLFTACNSDDDLGITESISTKTKSNHFYGVKYADIPQTRGVAQRTKLWHPSANIKVKFLNGTADLQSKVETYAKEWEQYMSVTFEFVTEGNADVRIGFDWNDERYVTWSYVGTDCKAVTNQSEATMSFAYFDSATDREIRADVLRAFGQVLGLELEHRHLNFDAGWTTRISDYWEGEIEDIPWETLKQYVFDPLLSGDILQTEEYDPNSIMIWPFDRRYANNTAREQNYDLSESDIEFVSVLYPPIEDGVAILMKTNGLNVGDLDWVGIYFDNDTSITPIIDWGDGDIRPFGNSRPGYTYSTSRAYRSDIKHTIKVYANPQYIERVYTQGFPIGYIDVSKCVNLNWLNTQGVYENLDLSKNTKLKYLNLDGSMKLRELDLSKNILLEQLVIMFTGTSSLDLSKNTALLRFTCESMPLEYLDISKCVLLKEIRLFQNNLSDIDLSMMTELEHIKCNSNPITELDVSNNVELSFLDVGDTSIGSLDLSNNNKLTLARIGNTPLENNIPALIDFANSLPYREHRDAVVYLDQNKEYIRDILNSKNWYIYGEQ